MKIKAPINSNYSAVVSHISNIITLDNCDNVVHAVIMGNMVIVSKGSCVGDIGLYFPVETQLSHEYITNNNMYRHSEKNIDNTKKGYFEDNGRIRSVKFRGHKSQGLFMPLSSLSFVLGGLLFTLLNEGDEFDEIKGINICKKYIVKIRNKGTNLEGTGKRYKTKVSKIVDGQFKFHEDTNQFYKNYHKLEPESLISLTAKVHGTSAISSNILCKRKLNSFEKFLKWMGVKLQEVEYDNIFSSRKVVKNDDLNVSQHFYDENVWSNANDILKEFLEYGMTIYYEIVGYTKSGGKIQGGPKGTCYDYGCESGEFKIYIYRITYTNSEGKVFEFSMNQVNEWCTIRGLNPVTSLYYGKAIDLYSNLKANYKRSGNVERWQEQFFNTLKEDVNFHMEQLCPYCNDKVPFEGLVIRIDDKFENAAYKLKCERFYNMETKMLDTGETNLEDNDQ